MELEIERRNERHLVLFDDQDAALVEQHRWAVLVSSKPGLFYALTSARKTDGGWTKVLMHRLLLPGHRTVDHINHNGLDNRRTNLRAATGSQQGANQQPRGGSSQYKGVSWDKGRSKWFAKIEVDDRQRHLGRFASEVEAARAAWGSFALTNFQEVSA